MKKIFLNGFNFLNTVPQVFICEEYEFNCDVNKCLNNSKMCDSLLDCEDGVDESSCDKQKNVSTSIPSKKKRFCYSNKIFSS